MSAGAPSNVAQKNLIDKVAQYVTKNGSQFEQMMREKQRGNPEYSFLFQNGAFNKYYLSKVRSEQIAQKVICRSSLSWFSFLKFIVTEAG
jgi:calcium homeostasis ER protein